MCYLLSGVLKGAPGKEHILVSVLQHGKNLHGHTKKMHPDSLYHTVTLCGHLHDLSSLSTSMSCLISPLLPEFTHSFSQRLGCPKCCPMRLHFLAFFFSFVFLASFYLCAAAPPPALQASHWQTAVDHKMVDQSLFPAHPNWRLLGEQLGYRSDPTFY